MQLGTLDMSHTWQGTMAETYAIMTAGNPNGRVTVALGFPARAGARNWEGSSWGGMID